MSEVLKFYRLTEPFGEFSNFSPHGFEENGQKWPTVEHYFQAMKFPADPEYQERIRTTPSPMVIKRLGQTRKVRLREDWEAVKEEVMLYALRRKFEHPVLRELLLSTGDAHIIEDSPWDAYWGCGKDGTGKNRLGVLLMELREEYRLAE